MIPAVHWCLWCMCRSWSWISPRVLILLLYRSALHLPLTLRTHQAPADRAQRGVTSMESFLRKFFPDVYHQMKGDKDVSNYCRFDSELLTVFTSSLYVAGLVATLFASSVTRRFGRRTSILIGGTVFVLGSVFGGAAVNVYMLLLNRILLGIGLGFTNQSIPLYLSEMAPPQYRGAINNGFELCISIGILIANLINYGVEKIAGGWGWRLSLSLAAVPAAFLTVGAIFLPETPSFIIQRGGGGGDIDEARLLLQRLRGTTRVQKELDDLVSAASEASRTTATRRPFRNILRSKYRPQLVIALLVPFFNQVTGINVINFYAPVMFRTIGLKESASLMSAVVTRVCATAANVVAMVVVDRFGRRKLLLVGGVQMILSQVMVGAVLAAKFKDHGGMDKEYAYLVLVIMCVFVAGFAWSWGPLTYLVPTEICPLEIRSAGQSIVIAVIFFVTFLIGQTFLAMLCHLKFGTFFLFGGWVCVMTLFVYFFLPETKQLPMEQMEQVWRTHWFWKRIADADADAGEEEEQGQRRPRPRGEAAGTIALSAT
ncbi:hexose carrier protein HEX6-like isoform X2 [Sorghum bicolor]|uniref:hexose carrier protein HEX6-like isoform X2 n=1 Tax=Sorghum bicolor TaxID=4558 RepID=UPI000B426869|nr:hexose carrier protein HEX6-like isoform X2 [Sorghum bicolor]|eukprot:XP_021307453.1 hexose carrier protein HEX6-like isoform X2 [Sorghum bicolor]